MSALQPANRRVVVTGLGVICPLGNTTEVMWDSLISGRSGVAPLWKGLGGHFPVAFAGEARDFSGEVGDFGAVEGDQKKAIRKGLKVMCRECQMGVAAAQRAILDARLDSSAFDPERAGVVFGADYMVTEPEELSAAILACLDEQKQFHFSRWATDGMSKMSPLWLLKYLPNMPASHIAIYNDMRGPNNSLTQREAAGNLAIGEAFRVIARDHADIMVAGATGTRTHPMKAVHAALQEELADTDSSPHCAARPFDLNRTGMVLGEGAGSIVLEELSRAQARGAPIYGEVIAAGSSSVAGSHSVARRRQSMINSMRSALAEARGVSDKLGHIHAHGLGTRSCDAEEAQAIAEVLGSRSSEIPVTAAKSYFGNLGAGSGIVETIASVLALGKQRLFPILNYETPDPDCPIVAANGDGTSPGDSFLNLNVTAQGQASCVVVRRFE